MLTEKLTTLLIQDEGMRLKPYRCSAGKLTIGVGRNLDDVGITEEEALMLLKRDIRHVLKTCRETFSWFFGLSEVRQIVVASMIFNLGISRFLRFKKTIAYIQAQDVERAAVEMLDSKWATQVGRRADRLAHMMREG